jgi:thiamine biosynthesis lipoprotein
VVLEVKSRSVRLTRPGVTLDFGAVAKGFALDRAAAIVREHGVRSALLHGGTSSVVGIGAPPGEDGWRVAVRSDAEPRMVTLHNRAMSVSAPRGRRNSDGHGHILDPRTGASAGSADTAAVLCDRADVADAWSTALVVLGKRPAGMPGHVESLIHTGEHWQEASPAEAPDGFREVA